MGASVLEKDVFAECAAHYRNRVPYSATVVRCLASFTQSGAAGFRVAELAAGTGVLTQSLADTGLSGYAVEPNTAMRTEALSLGNGRGSFAWSAGTLEKTGLPDASVDWVCVGNAFHLANLDAAFAEARRILRPSGYLTAIWLLDDPRPGSFQESVETIIHERAPQLRQLHPPIEHLMEQVAGAPGFGDCLYVEAKDSEAMVPSRYMGIWKSSHLVPNAMNRTMWQPIFAEIEAHARRQASCLTFWRTRAWTVRKSEA